MGIFYNPPPPPTASNAGTPPEPHVPIGNQGNQPPRFSTAVMLVAVLASWPQDLEPRLSRPNDQRQKIAPLTLPYGQQPATVGTSIASEYALIAGQWPADFEPRLSAPNNLRQTIAPLTLKYGDQPPIIGTAAIAEAAIVSAWPADLEPRLGAPNNQQQHIAPLTLVYGDRPPTIGTSLPGRYALAVGAWPADCEPRLGPPNNARVSVAPLGLTYGSQPTPTPALNTPEFQAISAWPQPDWPAQASPKSLAWVVLPGTAAHTAFPYGLIHSTWPADLEPRLTRPNESQQKIAPLTLPTGTAPQPQPPLSVPELTTIVSAWPTTWDAQTAPKNAAWNVPPLLSAVPYAPLPRLIWTAWIEPFTRPPTPITIAPLTVPTGQALPTAPLSRPSLGIILANWPNDLEPRLELPNSSRQHIAPITLVYGAIPSPRPPLSASSLTLLVATWTPSWDAQTASKNVTPSSTIVVPALIRLLDQLFTVTTFAAEHVSLSGTDQLASRYVDAVLQDGAIAYWRMNDPMAADGSFPLTDLVGGHTGTAPAGSGITPQVAGVLADGDTAAALDGGSTSYYTVPDATAFHLTQGTFEIWFKLPIVLPGGAGSTMTPLAIKPPTFHGVQLVDGAARLSKVQALIPFTSAGSFSLTYESGQSLADNTFHQLVVTYDGAVLRLSVDGLQRASLPIAADTLSLGTGGVHIGASAGAQAFTGTLDEIAIYPTALTPDQVAEHYRRRTAQATLTAETLTVTGFINEALQ